jgi:two-component system response regulator NreC
MNIIRVCAIDDHDMILRTIESDLAKEADIKLVGTSTQGRSLEELIQKHSPDVVFLDLGMSNEESFEPASAVRKMRQKYPRVKFIVVTGYNDAGNMKTMRSAGASGYILKTHIDEKELGKAARVVHNGGTYYSPPVFDILLNRGELMLNEQELSVMRLAAKGYSNKFIADELGFAEKTVRNLLSNIYTVFGLDDQKNKRVAAINEARKQGLIPLE